CNADSSIPRATATISIPNWNGAVSASRGKPWSATCTSWPKPHSASVTSMPAFCFDSTTTDSGGPMNMTAQTPITEALEAIIRRFAPQNRGELRLTQTTHLVNEAGIDSPRMIDIVLEVEDQFGIVVDDADIQKVRTFGELVALVGSHTAAEAD